MRKIKKIMCIFLCLIFVLPLSFFTSAEGVEWSKAYAATTGEKAYCNVTIEQDFADDTVLVVLDKSISSVNKVHDIGLWCSADIAQVVDLTAITNNERSNEFSSKIEHSDFNQIIQLRLSQKGKENVLSVIAELEKIDGIISAEPDYIYSCQETTPDDIRFEFQNNLTNMIQIAEAWDITTGSSFVRIGIIDSGIAEHDDLNENIVQGWDFVNNNNITNDDISGHGTGVAGIIGAVGDNKQGIAGINWDISMVPLQVTYNGINARTSQIIDAITYATVNNIPILNCSIGGNEYSNALNQAIANYPGLIVCAAGNDHANIDNTPVYPAAYQCANLISVGNITNTNELAWDSNYGEKTVHLMAPGTLVFSTYLNEDYERLSGTSMAAPHVAGVAALIYSIRPDLTPVEIKNFILSNVDKDETNLGDKCITGGYLNAYKAVRAATEPQTFTGDVNGDGRSDMILSRRINGKRAITTYLGQSNGSFGNPITTQSTRNFVYTDPAFVGDFNGDGLTDMVVHWSNNNYRQLLVYISKGNGQFNEGVNLSSTRFHDPDQLPCKFFVADVNGDGCDDFVVHYRNTSGKRCMLVYQGKATSPYFVDATTDALVSTNTFYYNDPVYMGDFNGDGCADMLVQWIGDNYKRQLLVYKGNTDGTFSAGTNLASTKYHKMGAYPSQFAITDVDDDGKDDFVVHWRNDDGKRCNLLYKGKSASPYLTDATTDALVSTNNYVVDDPIFVGDFNGDGRSDMLVHWENNGYRQLLVYIANASGAYNAAIRCSTSNKHDPIKYAGSFYVADVNGDGKDDFIVKWREGLSIRFLTYLGTSSGEFGSAVRTVPNTDILYYNAA